MAEPLTASTHVRVQPRTESTARSNTEIAGFVKAAVLVSKDGLFGKDSEEKALELTEEEQRALARSAQATNTSKSLFDQLQEQKDRQETDWKEKHNAFQPPRALDEEDVGFLEEIEKKRKLQDEHVARQAEEDRAAFELARAAKQAKTVAYAEQPASGKSQESKRTPSNSSSNNTKASPAVEVKVKHKPKLKHKKPLVKAAGTVATSISSGLVSGYGSGSDSA